MILKKDFKIQQISAKQTHAVRHPVLRTGKPIETCVFSGDEYDTTIHLGVFIKENLIGVSTLMQNNSVLFKNKWQYQLRGMAILKAYRGKGLGALLIEHSISLVKEKKTNLIWCNAREIAVNFYKYNGFLTIGKPFKIKEIGTHYVMYKKL